jgi:enoyl-[acyl-carrier protein] reductase I
MPARNDNLFLNAYYPLTIFKKDKIMSNLLSGKRGLIMGVANNMSIGWGIAKEAVAHGAELAFSYQGEILQKRIFPLAEEIGSKIVLECDVSKEESVKNLFEQIEKEWGGLDFIVHAIAFSDKDELKGRYLDTSLGNFQNSMNISCFSLLSVTKYAEKLMKNGGSIITLTYYGAEKVMPNYNVMGVAKAALEASVRYLANDLGPRNIRVNAISAGPIRTLAASGISDFRSMLKLHESSSPLRRNTTQEDVGKAAIYLISDLSSGVTGEVHYVDCGYNIMGFCVEKEKA